MYNFKARLYHPVKKIFLTPDPKHINYSPYTYTSNNPINLVDPTGMAPIFPNKGFIVDGTEAANLSSKSATTIEGSKVFSRGTRVSTEVTSHITGANNIKLIPNTMGNDYYFPFQSGGIGYMEVPKDVPAGTCVFTGPMNGCAIEVRPVGDNDVFYHDLNSKTLKNYGASSGLPGATAQPKARVAWEDYGDNLEEQRMMESASANGRANPSFHYDNVFVKNREKGWDVYSTEVNTNQDSSIPAFKKVNGKLTAQNRTRAFSVKPGPRAIQSGQEAHLLERFPE
ncbi:hypothetical protein T190115A13A_230001 [Tenacibaculum sp. 190524A02b]|uniref:RHS repeat-associated core domain-containing protein n=1 Tax=Tenacibaculum vairaonense TaxID=3137860 RepID=A0ABP1FBA4_9FLAO